MSKKIFISQPMNGRTDEQVLKDRACLIHWAKKKIGEDVEPLETFFDDFGPLQNRWIIWPAASNFWQRLTWPCSHPAGRVPAAAALSISALLTMASPSWRYRPMASCLMSDAPYAPWLSDVLAMLEENKIDRICVAAPLPGGEVFTGYYHMDMMDKAVVATNIQADATLDAVCANGRRIQEAWEEEGDDDE